MKQILDFSHNWNNKLDCRYFTTIRRSARFEIGDVVETWYGPTNHGEAEIVDKKTLTLPKISEWIAGLDTGYTAEETRTILRKMYKDMNDATPLFYYLCRYTEESWKAKKQAGKAQKNVENKI